MIILIRFKITDGIIRRQDPKGKLIKISKQRRDFKQRNKSYW